ncbi:DUF6919 domain-containing protein [Streptomyces mirabilis]|uniref:DUF6919 domain-containing protein n=1 Tax=Streptomyces mirabilis TaxID=68239 RepID=UPI00331DFF99
MRTPWKNRADRARWQHARTLTDLGQLTAAWWEGTLRSLPGHRANHRPHPTLTPQTAVLATANRAGFLIPAAQAGRTDGTVQQRTAVQGFVSSPHLIQRVMDAAEQGDLYIALASLHDANDGPGNGITVTTGDKQRDTVFGQVLGLEDLNAMWPQLPHAVDAVALALQVTLVDPQFGSSNLVWDTLAAAIGPAALPPAPMPDTPWS